MAQELAAELTDFYKGLAEKKNQISPEEQNELYDEMVVGVREICSKYKLSSTKKNWALRFAKAQFEKEVKI